MSLASASDRTMAYSCGYSCSVTGFDRVVAMAILSENQYIARLIPRPKAKPMARPPTPWNSTSPSNTKSPPRPALSTQVLTLSTPNPSSGAPDLPRPSPSEYDRPRPKEGAARCDLAVNPGVPIGAVIGYPPRGEGATGGLG